MDDRPDNRESEPEAEQGARLPWCVYCRSLLLPDSMGGFYCVYERMGRHEFARRAAMAAQIPPDDETK